MCVGTKGWMTLWQCGFLEMASSDVSPFCSCLSFSFLSLEALHLGVAEVGPKDRSNHPVCLQLHFSDFADSPVSLS